MHRTGYSEFHALRKWGLVLLLVVFLPVFSLAQWTGTDEEFIQMVESNNWDFFRYNQGGPYHLFRGSGHYDYRYSTDERATCAGDGFGIASLVVGAYRGWMNEEVAYSNILAILRSYDTQLQRDEYMFFNHYYNFETGAPQVEYSPIDSSWFICGALLAAQYFRGTEVETIANRIYGSTQYGSIGPLWNAYYEYIIVNILGAGSPTNGWSSGTARDAWESCTRASSDYMRGPLFWYQWPQAFVDFRHRVDSLGSNHYQIAMDAMLLQQRKCIELHNLYPAIYSDFGTNGWGLTSAGASMGFYLELRPFGGWCTWNTNYGTPGGCSYGTNYIASDEDACDSGTLVPICLPSCMSHTPREAREAMEYIYNTYDPSRNVYGVNSFINAFNTGQASSGHDHFSTVNATMDYGCNVVVMENFRSGIPWRYFMAHSSIIAGMQNCGFTTPNIAYHDDWNDGSDPNVWTGSTVYANTDGSNPTSVYESISYHNAWVNGSARKLVANGSGDVVRFELKEADQSKNDLLSFWLRGQNGGEQFDVGLRDAEGHEVRLSITNHVSNGSVSTNWTRVRIPVKRYAVSGNPNNDVRILFLGDFNIRFRAAGTVFIEDLAFVLDDLAPDPPSLGSACIDGRVSLRWDYSSHDDVVGYHLWRRPDAGSGFDRITTTLLSAVHSAIDPSVESQWGEDYFYAVQAVDRAGNAGAFSSDYLEQRLWIGRHWDLDWGDGRNPNTFGGGHGRWGGSWGDISFLSQTGWDGRVKWARRIEGDTSNGAYVELNGGNVGAYETLAFWMKQNWGANDFDVGLKSTNGVEVKVPITRYTVVTGSWVHVTIPLIDFRGVDFSAMDNVSFTFRTPGSVCIDEIRFTRLDQDADFRFVGEGENAGHGRAEITNDFKWNASGGRVLGDSWATNAGDDAWWALNPGTEMNEAYLDVRYACGASTGRMLQVLINDDVRTNSYFGTTGGWGDDAAQLSNETIRIGRITNTSFFLKLRTTNAGIAVNLDRVILRSGGRWFREAEDWDAQSGSGGVDSKPGASGGQVLGASWGGGDGECAIYSNIVFAVPVTNAFLQARYGQDYGDGRLIRVLIDGTNMGSLAFSRTRGWLERWSDGGIAELPLGAVGAGAHVLRLDAVGNDEDVNVDWLKIAEGAEPFKEYDTDADGIPDSQELLYGTSTNFADTDSDGLSDRDELSRLRGSITDPLKSDTDDDGVQDGGEVIAGTDPADSNSVFMLEGMFSAGDLTLRWRGATQSLYDVMYTDGGAWHTGLFQSVADYGDITGSNVTIRYTDDGTGTAPPPGDPSVRQRIYRIRAHTP